jgi:hypothetical protein
MGLVTAKEVAKAINAEKYGISELFRLALMKLQKYLSLINFMTNI